MRYFIGTGNRNLSDTNNWSLTSGGTGGASIPTSAINAIFDANSGIGIFTINANFACKDLIVNNLAGAVSFVGSVFTFSVFGHTTLPTTNLTITLTGTSYWYNKATSLVNITMGATAGRSFNRLYFDGLGGTWTLQDEMNVGNISIYLSAGTLDKNRETLSCIFLRTDTVTGQRTLYLRDSILNCGIYFTSGTTFTLYAGTSTVYSNTYLILPGTNYGLFNVYYSAVTSVDGNTGSIEYLTCNDLTITQSAGVRFAPFNKSSIINGILTLAGNNSTNNRLLVASKNTGTQVTITCNGTIVASNVDFRDITLAGSANRDLSAITAGSGDCGGNTGITFTPAQKQYYKHLGGGTTTFKDSTKWFSDAALTIAGRVPLPQDDWDCLSTSFNAPTTFQIDCPRIGRSMNLSGVNVAVIMQLMNAVIIHGSFRTGANITITGNYVTQFDGHGKTLDAVIYIGTTNAANNFDILTGNTYNELVLQNGSKFRLTAGTTQTIQKLTRGAGTSLITWDSITAAVHTINITGGVQNVDYINFRYCNVTQQNKLFAGLNSVDGGNNVNVVFNAIAAPIAPVEFTEYEVVESTLLGKGIITANFTEAETITTELLAKAFVEAVFTEGEEAATELLAKAFIEANFTESEIADFGEIVKGICISANFTEGEELALMVFEKITGQLTFSEVTITGQMVFTERITGNLKFL
jgi:hypothetical protein